MQKRALLGGALILSLIGLAGVRATVAAEAPADPATDCVLLDEAESLAGWRGLQSSAEQVKTGAVAGKWARPDKTATISCETVPADWTPYNRLSLWVYSAADLGAEVQLVIASENPQTEGPDYYSRPLKLDWQGWKQLTFSLKDFGATRTPLGWNQIGRVYVAAGGWGHTPRPEMVLYLDDIRLSCALEGEAVRISDQRLFELMDLSRPGLEAVRAAVEAGDWEKAKAAYLKFRLSAAPAKWWIDPAQRPTAAKSATNPEADKVLQHIIPNRYHMTAPAETFLGEKIDWQFNPVAPDSPDFTREWTWCNVNRMHFWDTLGRAYWDTLDEKYAREWVAQLESWIQANPVPMEAGPGDTLCWRTIEAGIRTAGSWMNAYHYFLGSEAFTPSAHADFVKALIWHGWRLAYTTEAHPERTGNWITMECNGLATIAMLFPELKDAAHWRQVAFDRLNLELDRQVYPDGSQIELTSGYHGVARENFARPAQLAQLNHQEIPGGYLDKLKKMYDFNLEVATPMGFMPPVNDSGRSAIGGTLDQGYKLWGDETFLFGATNREKGRRPAYDSIFLPYAGYHIMRSGWDYRDKYLFFDAGPIGYGHVHEDMLNLYLCAYGKILLTEPGNYVYDKSKWRRYVLSTQSHNTIIVDGLDQKRWPMEKEPLTQPLTNPWVTSPYFDFAVGCYASGYGPKKDKSVTHMREIVFLRPFYWVVADFLEGTGQHDYEAHYHLDAPKARVEKEPLSVQTGNPKAQLGLWPLDPDGLSTEIVQGREDPVLGWIPTEKRKIPTVVFKKSGAAPQRFSTLLYPYQGEVPGVAGAELAGELPAGVWAKGIHTPREEAAVLLDRRPERSAVSCQPWPGAGPVAVCARAAVFRVPVGQPGRYGGFYELSAYRDEQVELALDRPGALLLAGWADGRLALFNPGAAELTLKLKTATAGEWRSAVADGSEVQPLNSENLPEGWRRVSLPPQRWVWTGAETLKPEELRPFVEPTTVSRLPSYESYRAKIAALPVVGAGELIVVEAERMQLDPGIGISEGKVNARSAVYGWDDPGQKLNAEFTVAQPGLYKLACRYCTPGYPVRSIRLDGEVPFAAAGAVKFPPSAQNENSDGWSNTADDWRLFCWGEGEGEYALHLSAGTHQLTLENESGGGLNLDYLVLYPAALGRAELERRLAPGGGQAK